MRWINKPEYFYNPKQFFKRAKLFFHSPKKSKTLVLPWGDKININTNETIGKSILHYGLYDLCLSEALWRLIEPGDIVADVGANIGYISLLMAKKTGDHGKVYCFEPHPKIYESLKLNTSHYKNVQAYNLGLSREKGQMTLYVPTDFYNNEGLASLEKINHSTQHQIEVATMDEVFKNNYPKIIKIDVEGHEYQVLLGAHETLKHVENILFEDFKGAGSEVIELLQGSGFIVYRLAKKFNGLELLSVEEGMNLPLWEPPNYLATRFPDKVRRRIAAKGWQIFDANVPDSKAWSKLDQ